MHAARALRSPADLIGESAEHALHGIAEVVERGRLHRLGDAERQSFAVSEMDPETAEDERPREARMARRDQR